MTREEAGIEVKIARLFAFVGPYLPLDRHFAVGNFSATAWPAGRSHHGRRYAVPLLSVRRRPGVWLWTILVNGAAGRPYNVGSDRPLSIEAVARTVADALSPSVEVTRAGTPDPAVPPARYVPDASRARSELGLEEWIGFEDGVRRTLQWAGRA